MTRLAGLLAAAMLALCSNALAHGYEAGDIEIHHPHARATPPGAANGAAYLGLTNRGAAQERLLSASGAVAGRIEIHETRVTDSVVAMRPVPEGVAIAPGARVDLAPGGYHLMLIDLRHPLAEGERVPIVLTFETAGDIEVELAIEPAIRSGENDPHAGH